MSQKKQMGLRPYIYCSFLLFHNRLPIIKLRPIDLHKHMQYIETNSIFYMCRTIIDKTFCIVLYVHNQIIFCMLRRGMARPKYTDIYEYNFTIEHKMFIVQKSQNHFQNKMFRENMRSFNWFSNFNVQETLGEKVEVD